MKKHAEKLIQIRTRKPIMVNVKMCEIKMGLAQCSLIKELWAFNQRKMSSHSLIRCQNNLASFYGSCT